MATRRLSIGYIQLFIAEKCVPIFICQSVKIVVNSMMSCRTLTIGTDCSGIEAPIEALIQMKVPFVHKWSCDSDKFVRMSIEANYKPEIMYEDVTKRNNGILPDVDIYVCGFPCQPFSTVGSLMGTKDDRGNIVLYCIDVIKKKTPKLFILENVKNFKSIENGRPCLALKTELESLGLYNLHINIYNTKDYGIPQNRERIYFVGIRKDIQYTSYQVPKHVKMKALDDFIIDKRIHNVKLAPSRVLQIKKKYHVDLSDLKGEYVVSPSLITNMMKDVAPTLLRRSHYLVKYKRYLTPRECLLLQGFSRRFKIVVSDTQTINQAGNAMSVNVLKAIFRNVFKCTNLC